MARYNRKKVTKLRKSHIGISITLLIIISLIGIVLLSLLFSFLLSLFIKTKSENCLSNTLMMADFYNSLLGEEEKTMYEVLDNQRMEYFVLDKQGNLVHNTGSYTCDFDNSVDYSHMNVTDDREQYNIKIYSDTDNTLLDPVSLIDGEIGYIEFARTIIKDEEKGRIFGKDNVAHLMFWMSADVKDGTMFCRGEVTINTADLSYMILIMSTLVFMIAMITLILIINIIINLVDQHKMKKLLFMDNVTQDHNWIRFYLEAGELLEKGRNARKKFAIVNLVFVKYRNYVLCHSVEEGEIELRKVYNLIRRSIGKKDLLGHDTSSSFAMLIQYHDEKELKANIQNIIDELSKINANHDFSFQAGVDLIPVSSRKRRNVDVDALYNNACAARMSMDSTDASGIAFFNKQMVEEHKWIDSIHELQQKALEAEEFIVYYQPKYNPRNDKLVGAEALIRWQSPELGFVSPGRFIPVFEDNGFITEIDHYMLKHVAADQKRWSDEGFDCVPVSVNVSRAHFIEDDLAEQIRDIVKDAGCNPEFIEIELTESAFFDDKNAMINTIGRLKEYGFSVSMDDFGSGYSSLNSLKDMPLDVLKLDAGFFRDMTDDGRGEIVVSEAIRLAKCLNMKTVAEGVEDKEQVDFLAAEGCDMIQGYYYAKPMPSEEYMARMEKAEMSDTADTEPSGGNDIVE